MVASLCLDRSQLVRQKNDDYYHMSFRTLVMVIDPEARWWCWGEAAIVAWHRWDVIMTWGASSN